PAAARSVIRRGRATGSVDTDLASAAIGVAGAAAEAGHASAAQTFAGSPPADRSECFLKLAATVGAECAPRAIGSGAARDDAAEIPAGEGRAVDGRRGRTPARRAVAPARGDGAVAVAGGGAANRPGGRED